MRRRRENISTPKALAALGFVALLGVLALLGFYVLIGQGLLVILIVLWLINALMKYKPPRNR